MERLFEEFADGGPLHWREQGTMAPAMEISDAKDAVVVKAQLRGVSKANIHLSVSDQTLTLNAEMKEEATTEDKNYHRREFHYGTLSRTIALPTPVRFDRATATLKDGVLEVTMPKSEQSKSRAIPIRT
jgi:HSP20 family protein